MSLIPVDTLASLEPILAGEPAAFVFKHSTRCPISARAADAVDAFVDAHPEIPVHRILVVEQRPVSMAVADRLGVKHASPQIILVRDGAAAWNASHHGITAEAMAKAWTT